MRAFLIFERIRPPFLFIPQEAGFVTALSQYLAAVFLYSLYLFFPAATASVPTSLLSLADNFSSPLSTVPCHPQEFLIPHRTYLPQKGKRYVFHQQDCSSRHEYRALPM